VRLRDEIRSVQQRLGVTTIMVTHDQEEALAMADRIVVMNAGVIEQIGTPLEIYQRPATPFVADFVGHMTFFDAVATGPKTVRVGNLELAVATGPAFQAGSPVRLAMRPEEVRTRAVTAATPNAFQARVGRLSFLGSFHRAKLQPTGSPGLSVAADLSANAMRDLDIDEGQVIAVALPPETLRVFPSETAV
jgi:iron(III) transport system ATP-binding protein